MQVQRETYFEDEIQSEEVSPPAMTGGFARSWERDDPTLIWTDSRSLRAVPEVEELESPRTAAVFLWNLTAALGVCGAVLFMRALAMEAPVWESNARARPRGMDERAVLAVEHASTVSTPRRADPPAPSQVDSHTAEAEVQVAGSARKSVARARTRAGTKMAALHASATGTLRINSLPWAEIYLDGHFVGTTPQANLLLGAGHHRVKLVNQPMEMSKTFVVEIKSGKVVTKSMNLSQ
jgi:PEGA domain-containing protein